MSSKQVNQNNNLKVAESGSGVSSTKQSFDSMIPPKLSLNGAMACHFNDKWQHRVCMPLHKTALKH